MVASCWAVAGLYLWMCFQVFEGKEDGPGGLILRTGKRLNENQEHPGHLHHPPITIKSSDRTFKQSSTKQGNSSDGWKPRNAQLRLFTLQKEQPMKGWEDWQTILKEL
ncbi:hypothetical protein RU639_011591 [Aspergillus parasiticus]